MPGRPRIRRLVPPSLGWQSWANPFELARRAQRGDRSLRIALEAGLTKQVSDEQRELLKLLDVAGNKGTVEFLVLHTAAELWMPRHTPLTIATSEDGVLSADTTDATTLIEHECFIVPDRFGDHTTEFMAFGRMDVDVIVTADADLLAKRDAKNFAPLNLLTPEEAAVLIGVWSRTVHAAFLPRTGCNNGFYYWATSRALTPSAWPAFCAFVRGERVLAEGQDVAALAGSILDHLKMLIRSFDRMIATWQCNVGNDTMDELFHDFSHVVLDAWTVHDNIALLAGRYLEIELEPRNGPEWELLHGKWQRAMRAGGQTDGRALDLLAHIETERPVIISIKQLRNHLAHRARDRMVRTSGSSDREDATVHLTGGTLDVLVRELDRTLETASGWGIGTVVPAQRVSASNTDGDRWQETWPKHADLDVISFAARTIAHTAATADAAFRLLRPETDRRIPRIDTCGQPPTESWAIDEAADFVLACSGVAGLVDRHAT